MPPLCSVKLLMALSLPDKVSDGEDMARRKEEPMICLVDKKQAHFRSKDTTRVQMELLEELEEGAHNVGFKKGADGFRDACIGSLRSSETFASGSPKDAARAYTLILNIPSDTRRRLRQRKCGRAHMVSCQARDWATVLAFLEPTHASERVQASTLI